MVYEYLLQYTEDPYVKETLRFLMTREVAHFQMFEAALGTIQPNFPPGVLQSDPRFSNVYFNMSSGNDFSGPWNSGKTTQFGEEIQYIADPISYVMETNGLLEHEASGTDRTEASVQKLNKELSKQKSAEVNNANPLGSMQWNMSLEEVGDGTKQHSKNGNSRTSHAKK
jgi:Mn-containing catalase